MKRDKRSRREAGFTLVEALVSIFVFAIISAGCVAMLTQSADAQRRVAEAHSAMRELDVARALLAADAAQLVSRPTRTAQQTIQPPFLGGTPDIALAFVRASAEPNEATGGATYLQYVEYKFVDGALVRRSRPYLDATLDTPENERVVLADAQEARFEFLDGANWRESWSTTPSGGRMPSALALTAQLPRYGKVRIEALIGASP